MKTLTNRLPQMTFVDLPQNPNELVQHVEEVRNVLVNLLAVDMYEKTKLRSHYELQNDAVEAATMFLESRNYHTEIEYLFHSPEKRHAFKIDVANAFFTGVLSLSTKEMQEIRKACLENFDEVNANNVFDFRLVRRPRPRQMRSRFLISRFRRLLNRV